MCECYLNVGGSWHVLCMGRNTPFALPCTQLKLGVPFRSAGQIAQGITQGRLPSAGGYILSYLDEDMLIGRPVSLGGTFIFTRAA